MVFTSKEEREEWIDSSIDSSIIDQERKNFLDEMKYAPDFYFYPLPHSEDVDYTKDFSKNAPFDPKRVAEFLVSAHDSISYSQDSQNLKSTDMPKFQQAFQTAVERGLNIEQLKLALATIYNNQKADVLKNGKKSVFYGPEIQRTYNLLVSAERVCKEHSPYEKVFEMGEKLAILEREEDKLNKDLSISDEEFKRKEAQITNQIDNLKDDLKKECAKFDPQLLKNVVEDRQNYLLEVDKSIAMDKKQNFYPDLTRATDEFKGLQAVKFTAISEIKREDRNAGK